jgi:PilZ domain
MAYKTRFIGRMEKRLPIAIVVRLAREQGQSANGAEMTYTDNVSAHGARVVSRHAWETGEAVTVTSLKDEIAIRAKVVYCHQVTGDRYYVGLNFHDRRVTWSTYATYANS